MLKAIQTPYKGYRFRSRLEARWAVFFDALGMRWEYEPEGFELPNGRYLPDFFVHMRADHHAVKQHPGAGYWVEVKGGQPTERELTVLRELCSEGAHHGHLVVGLPGDGNPVWLCWGGELPKLSTLALFMEAFVSECSPLLHKTGVDVCRVVEEAVAAARGARFEHGERGAPAGVEQFEALARGRHD